MDLPRDLERLTHEQFMDLYRQVRRLAEKGQLPPRSSRDLLEAEALRRHDEAQQVVAEADRQIHFLQRKVVGYRIGQGS